MKNLTLASLALLGCLSLKAQVEITTKSFELASQNKQNGWNIMDAGRDSNNQIYIKFSQPICDETKNTWSGTRTYKGLKWNIDKLVFDNTFTYQNTETKHYPSSEEAIVNNEYVFGKNFMPSTDKGLGAMLVSSVGLPNKPINNSFMFTNIVVPTISLGGFKIITSYVTCMPLVSDTKTKGTLCGEIPVVSTVNSQDAKEIKGQRWLPMYSNASPNGGTILFNTVGVGPEDKQHFVLRKYDSNGEVIKEKSFSFDYQCLPIMKEIEKEPGVFDFVLIITTINYKKSKMPVAPANQYEYFRIDGDSYEIKDQFKFNAPSSNWIISDLVEKEGEVYFFGVSGTKSDVYKDFGVPKLKEYSTFQIAKVAKGKLEYIKLIDQAAAKKVIKQVPGTKGSIVVSFQYTAIKTYSKNGRFFITAQNNFDSKFGPLVCLVFSSNGNLESYLAKPEKMESKETLHFNATGTSAYWVLEDLALYNEYNEKAFMGNGKIGGYVPKKYKFVVNGLSVVKYDIANQIASPIQSFVNEEWGLSSNNTQLFETENEIVFLGNKLTKKAKEGEVVFITMKK